MFKEKLKELRIKSNLSQAELANKIFVSRSAIAKWENGLGIPSDVNLESLCNLFKVSEEELMTREDLKECIRSQKNKRQHNYIDFLILALNLIILIFTISILNYNFINDRLKQEMSIFELFNTFELIFLFSSIFFSIAIQIILLLTRNGVIVINKDISKISIFKKTSFAITIVSFLFFSILAYLRMSTQLKYHNFLVGFIEILIWIGFLILVILYYYLENKKQNKLVLVFSIINYILFTIAIIPIIIFFVRVANNHSTFADIFMIIIQNFVAFISCVISLIAIIFSIKSKKINKSLLIINISTVLILLVCSIIAYNIIY